MSADSVQAQDGTASLSARLITNAAFSVLAWLWPVCLNLATMPYIVRALGDEAFGVLALIQTTVGFLSFMDLGLNFASIKFIAQYSSSGRDDEIQKVVGVTLAVYGLVGLAGMLAIGLASNWLAATVLRASPRSLSTVTAAFQIGALTFLANTVASVFSAVPIGLQRFDISTKITAAMATLTIASTLAVLALGGGLLEVVLARLAVSACSIMVFLAAARRLVPVVSIRPQWDWRTCRDLLSFGGATVVTRMAAKLIVQVDRLLIGTMLGAAAVTYYVVPATAVQQVHQFLSSATMALFPACSTLSNQGQAQVLRRLYLRANRQSTAVATAVYLPLILLGPALLRIWMGAEFAQRSGSTFTFLALSYYLLSYNVVSYHVANGLGKPGVNAASAVVGGMIDVSLCVVLIPRLGIVGAAVASMASMVRIPVYVLVVNNCLMSGRTRSMLRRVYCRPWLAAVAVVASAVLVRPSPKSLPELAGVAVLLALSYVALALLGGVFDAADRRRVAQWGSSMLGKLRAAATGEQPRNPGR